MGGALELNLKISKEIINPQLEDEKIKEKAKSLGFKGDLNFEGAVNLYDVIISELIAKITEYMKTDEAKSICKYVKIYSPRASFSSSISERLHKQILKIYHIDIFGFQPKTDQQKSLSSWVWSLLGY